MDYAMEYALMSDMYDEYALEAFKAGSFGEYLRISSKGKIRAFFRALFGKIADFFKKLVLKIKMLVAKAGNKEKYAQQLKDVREDRFAKDIAGRLADILRKAKTPAIKVSAFASKIMNTKQRVHLDDREFNKFTNLVKFATNEVDSCITDLIRALKFASAKANKYRGHDPNEYTSAHNRKEYENEVSEHRREFDTDEERQEDFKESVQLAMSYIHFRHGDVFDDLMNVYDKCHRVFNNIRYNTEFDEDDNSINPENMHSMYEGFRGFVSKYNELINYITPEGAKELLA